MTTQVTPPPTDDRLRQALVWANSKLPRPVQRVSPVSGDASFRRYFRLHTDDAPLILMDAPPAQEDSSPFVDIAGRLAAAGIHAPAIHQFDLGQGFGLLEDLGDTLYRGLINASSVDEHFPGLFALLAQMASQVDCSGLPDYSAAKLQQELDLFTDWYLEQHKQRPLAARERTDWQAACATLLHNAAGQPQVFVHRDFHSCNLLHLPGAAPGVIDFQDGVRGPLSYDFISLAWDRYIAWSRSRLELWMEDYRQLLEQRLDAAIDRTTWVRWCDLMGVQRNLKIVGIFARLHYRDHKPGYLDLIPRFYQYLLDVVPRYPELTGLGNLLEQESCAP